MNTLERPWLTLSFTVIAVSCSFTALHAKEKVKESPSMKQAQKEASELGKGQLNYLRHLLLEKNGLTFSNDDMLPDSDKGKAFDADSADKDYYNAQDNIASSELKNFLHSAKQAEIIDEGESFLVQGNAIIKNPHAATDIVSIDTTQTSEEDNLQICQESGLYQMTFHQTLSVEATPEQKEQIKHCKGHKKTKEFYWKSDAEKERDSKKSSFKKQQDRSEIDSYDVSISKGGVFTDYAVIATWHHTDNQSSCDSYTIEDKVVRKAEEKDQWMTDDISGLSHVESSPFCRLIDSQITQGPETRIINGQPVTRESWARQLLFSCEPSSDSKCAQLRAQDGILKWKKCLEQNDLGGCVLWEKAYQLSKKAASQTTEGSFKGDPLWGLNGEFDSSYTKNEDFGSAISTLSIFSELEQNLSTENTDHLNSVKIFKGEPRKCQKSFLEGNVFDCCKAMDGLAVKVKLARCTTPEQCLSEDRHEGKCHFVDTQKVKLSTVTEHIYCCFSSKLARIIQEEGRKQLGIKWGDAEKPKCRGLSLEELKRIDFSRLDLTEVIADLKIDKQLYENKLRHNLGSLQGKIQSEIQKQRFESPDAESEHADE
jgi:conjugal transfer mating pair stabilization protein TraN